MKHILRILEGLLLVALLVVTSCTTTDEGNNIVPSNPQQPSTPDESEEVYLVSRYTWESDYEIRSYEFDYDSKNRVRGVYIHVEYDYDGYDGEFDAEMDMRYSGNQLEVSFGDDEDVTEYICELNSSGYITLFELEFEDDENYNYSYVYNMQGYLKSESHSYSDDEETDEVFYGAVLNWNSGNLKSVEIDDEGDQTLINMSYNSKKTSKVNLDVNACVEMACYYAYTPIPDNMAQIMGLLGKKSKNYITSSEYKYSWSGADSDYYEVVEYEWEYDKKGRPTECVINSIYTEEEEVYEDSYIVTFEYED